MKKNLILLSCAYASTVLSILFALLFSGEVFAPALGILCATAAAILFGVGLNGIIEAKKGLQAKKDELETANTAKLLDALTQSQELAQKNNDALIQSYTDAFEKLQELIKSHQEQIISISKETISTVKQTQTQLSDKISDNLSLHSSSILKQLTALEKTVCSLLEKLNADSQSTGEFQEVLIAEVAAINKLLTTGKEKSITDELCNTNRQLNRLLDKQAELTTKIIHAIEDGTEDLSDQLSSWYTEINKELSATQKLLQSYSDITERDAAQIRALLEDYDE